VSRTTRVEYGEDPSQYGELTLPEGTSRGVVVVIHGGFWKPEYGIEYAQPLVPSLVDAGWATWAIEYRRGTGAADTLADVRAAIDALPVEADTVVGIGHSAGGHLVTWAVDGGGLTHVVSQAGVLDLRAAHRDGLGGGAVERFLGHPPGNADAGVDPIRMVPLDVPLWCVHGRDDDVVPISQSQGYVAAATAAGGRAELVEVDGDHFVVIDPASDAWTRTLAILDEISPR
jgi:acetyl esterase/lipase